MSSIWRNFWRRCRPPSIRCPRDGIRISYVASKGRELAGYMADTLDDDWKNRRGMEIESVALASISYDEESQKLIQMRNQGAMMGDPSIREGYMQSAVARGLEAAGSNAAGSAAGFMGMGLGMQAGAGVLGAASAANHRANAESAAAWAGPGIWPAIWTEPGRRPGERRAEPGEQRAAHAGWSRMDLSRLRRGKYGQVLRGVR